MKQTSPGAVLVLGGARSGKSAFAERLVTETGLSRHYIATGRAFDDEMRARIAKHRDDRGNGWETHEEPLALAARIADVAREDRAVLVDCLTLWLTNWLMPVESTDADQQAWASQSATFLRALREAPGPVILVGNEIGLGVIPMGREVRAFVDALGVLNQQVAGACSRMTLMVAGLPLSLKDE